MVLGILNIILSKVRHRITYTLINSKFTVHINIKGKQVEVIKNGYRENATTYMPENPIVCV